jgi:hypothetical protein
MSGIRILVNSGFGVYIPQAFADMPDSIEWGLTDKIRDVLLAGPDDDWEQYWDLWNDILGTAVYEDKDGNEWHVHQEGDVFAYCEDLMTDKEYKDFFGVTRPE